jgi:hypothetical protein
VKYGKSHLRIIACTISILGNINQITRILVIIDLEIEFKVQRLTYNKEV